jgi:hypothetical protein
MKRGRPSISHAAALAALFGAYRRYGAGQFRVNLNGPNAGPLKQARDLGWCWWPTADTCCLTTDGVKALAPYRVAEGVTDADT